MVFRPMKGDVAKVPVEGGGQRADGADKPRFDLLWTDLQPYERQMLTRDAEWYRKGAEKYGARNWEQFSTPEALEICFASLHRHVAQLQCGDETEDHAAAIRANVQFIEYIKDRIAGNA